MNSLRSDATRRSFLKTGLAGLAGLAAIPSAAACDSQEEGPKEKKAKKHPTRTLGATGLELPVVNMGVMNADNPNLVKAALDAGIILFDTAHYYQRGRNEEMVGEVLKGLPRESFYVATKARATAVDRAAMQDAEQVEDETVASFIEKVEISLKRLGLDYVDILYLHSAKSKSDAQNKVVLEAQAKLKKAGKIRFTGITTHSNEPEVLRAATELKAYDVIEVAYNFRQPHRKDVTAAIAEATKAGIGIVAMKTQAGVYWDRDRTRPINMKAALKWVLENKNVTTAIPGFTTFDQLALDISVMEDLDLTPEERGDLDLGDNLGMPGLYCPQCGRCGGQCPEGIEIPTLMRSYMYAYGYRNLACAKATLAEARVTGDPCKGCSSCAVSCQVGFDVKAKIQDIARLAALPSDFLA